MHSRIDEAIERIRDAGARDARRNGHAVKIAFIYNLIFFPFALGMLTGNYGALTTVGWWAFWLPMSLIGAIAIGLALIQIIGPSNAAELYFDSRAIIDHARDLYDDRARTLCVAKAATVCNSVVLGWISAIPGYVLEGIDTQDQMEEAATEIITQVVEQRRSLFGMNDSDELWNFAIYMYDSKKQLLFPVVRLKHPNHPGSEKGRIFRAGQGHVGKAFADRVTKITADAEAPDVRNLMDAAPDLTRDYDNATYRSYASVPIGTDQINGCPFGVIVATSDHAGRFNLDNTNVLRLAASVLANVIELTQYDFHGPSIGSDAQPTGIDAALQVPGEN